MVHWRLVRVPSALRLRWGERRPDAGVCSPARVDEERSRAVAERRRSLVSREFGKRKLAVPVVLGREGPRCLGARRRRTRSRAIQQRQAGAGPASPMNAPGSRQCSETAGPTPLGHTPAGRADLALGARGSDGRRVACRRVLEPRSSLPFARPLRCVRSSASPPSGSRFARRFAGGLPVSGTGSVPRSGGISSGARPSEHRDVCEAGQILVKILVKLTARPAQRAPRRPHTSDSAFGFASAGPSAPASPASAGRNEAIMGSPAPSRIASRPSVNRRVGISEGFWPWVLRGAAPSPPAAGASRGLPARRDRPGAGGTAGDPVEGRRDPRACRWGWPVLSAAIVADDPAEEPTRPPVPRRSRWRGGRVGRCW